MKVSKMFCGAVLISTLLLPAPRWAVALVDPMALPRFTVAVAVGNAYIKKDYDEKRVRLIVEETAKYFRVNNIIDLEWDEKVYYFPDDLPASGIGRIGFFKSKFGDIKFGAKPDIIIGFVRDDRIGGGSVDDEKRIALINNYRPLSLSVDIKVLIQEIGHLFGAIHTGIGDEDTLMNPNVTDQTQWKFDEVNLKRILKYRHLRTFDDREKANDLLPRQIDVNVAVDESYIKDVSYWQLEIVKIIKRTSVNFENLSKPLAFRIKEVVLWQSTSDKMKELADELMKVKFNNWSQIIIGFTGRETDSIGIGEMLGNYAVVARLKPGLWPQSMKAYIVEEQASTLTHEIGHIFDADHVDDTDSFMNELEPSLREQFDQKSIETITSNRDRLF